MPAWSTCESEVIQDYAVLSPKKTNDIDTHVPPKNSQLGTFLTALLSTVLVTVSIGATKHCDQKQVEEDRAYLYILPYPSSPPLKKGRMGTQTG